jgi:hypothetical protein
MFKKITILCFLLSFTYTFCQCQHLLGISNSNYAGTQGIYMNPASIAQSPYKVYVNVLAVQGHFSNNFFRYEAPYSLLRVAVDGLDIEERNKQERTPSGDKRFAFGLDFRLPSVLYRINSRHTVAFTTRFRDFDQGVNIVEDISKLIKTGSDTSNFRSLLDIGKSFTFHSQTFTETAFSYGGTLIQKGPHRLQAGITAKWLAGLYSAYFLNRNFDYVLRQDEKKDLYLDVKEVDFSYGYSQLNYKNNGQDVIYGLTGSKTPGTGWGMDVGLSYEFRPASTEIPANALDYKLKVGVALVDLGGIRYKNSPDFRGYDIVRRNIQVSPADLESNNQENYDQILTDALDVQPAERKASFRMSLPTALHLTVDYRFKNNFFVNATWVQSIRPAQSITVRQNSVIALTPRWEKRRMEVALPLSWLPEFGFVRTGILVRYGPVWIGSDNVIGTLNIGNPLGADFYAGVNVPIGEKNKK